MAERDDGAQGRNRTSDTRIFSPLLYQLSYLGICAFALWRRPYTGFVLRCRGGATRKKRTFRPLQAIHPTLVVADADRLC